RNPTKVVNILIKSNSKTWKSLSVQAAVIVVLVMLLPNCAKADAVSEWSYIANTVVNTAETRPPASMIDFAYVHIAIYDAVNAIDGRYSVFSATPSSSAAGASPEAATAAAAYTMLKALYPAQQAYLDSVYANYLLSLPAGIATTRGIAVGTEVASAFLAHRAGDGRYANVPYVFSFGPGAYQLTPGAPPVPIAPLFPWVAKMKPFALDSASQFRAD